MQKVSDFESASYESVPENIQSEKNVCPWYREAPFLKSDEKISHASVPLHPALVLHTTYPHNSVPLLTFLPLLPVTL